MSNVTQLNKIKRPPRLSQQAIDSALNLTPRFACCYCQETKYGGLFDRERGFWTISGPHENIMAYSTAILRNLANFSPKYREAIGED
ncbi:MAG: hypothetical protein AAF756_10865 [Pseudomonadota bacterium]